MQPSNQDIELGERRVEAEREAMIYRAQAALAEATDTDCMDCGDPIGTARKSALPSARRCLSCQMNYERKS